MEPGFFVPGGHDGHDAGSMESTQQGDRSGGEPVIAGVNRLASAQNSPNKSSCGGLAAAQQGFQFGL
jgi:hypothetical protein